MNTQQKILDFWGKYVLATLTLLSIFQVMFLIYHFPNSQISVNALILGLLNSIRFELSTISYILLPLWVIDSIFPFPFFKRFNLGHFIPIFKIYSIMILVFFVLDVGGSKEYYTQNRPPKTFNLTPILETKPFHQNMEQTMLYFFKISITHIKQF